MLFAACAGSKNKSGPPLEPWIGHTKDEVMEGWGTPSYTYTDAHGGEVLTYTTIVKSRIYHTRTMSKTGMPVDIANGYRQHCYRTFYSNAQGIIDSVAIIKENVPASW
ncbi:MAG: hypothetical protein K0Q79_926 [Flavipsychrobacter sp.]|nr:hypothetical protein [Flavipsychrobacter sp.]